MEKVLSLLKLQDNSDDHYLVVDICSDTLHFEAVMTSN